LAPLIAANDQLLGSDRDMKDSVSGGGHGMLRGSYANMLSRIAIT
jgi:hypothetical protein